MLLTSLLSTILLLSVLHESVAQGRRHWRNRNFGFRFPGSESAFLGRPEADDINVYKNHGQYIRDQRGNGRGNGNGNGRGRGNGRNKHGNGGRQGDFDYSYGGGGGGDGFDPNPVTYRPTRPPSGYDEYDRPNTGYDRDPYNEGDIDRPSTNPYSDPYNETPSTNSNRDPYSEGYQPSTGSNRGSTGTTKRPSTSGSPIQFSRKDCGTTKAITSRIVGGKHAIDHEYPWQVSIQVNHLPVSGGEYTQYCGGAILNERWILTAAHCLAAPLSAMKGVVGTNDVGNPGRTAKEFYFDKAIGHESYNEKNKQTKYNNDIALLRTKTKIPFDSEKTINSICLPEKNQKFNGYASVAGWGKTSELGDKSDKLQKVDVPVLNSTECKRVYKTLFDDRLMMCAGVLSGGKDSCQADSGGPLVQPIVDKSYVIGVVSYGIGCARKGNPGVYTRVTNYIDWINETMKKNT